MRIALAGDLCTLPSGYGKQILELGRQLVLRGNEVANFAVQHAGPPRDVDGIVVHSFGEEHLQATAFAQFRPEVTVHVRDSWALIDDGVPGRSPRLMSLARRYSGSFVAYTPVDNDYYPPSFVDTVSSKADLTLVTTDWGVNVLEKLGAPRDRLGRLYPGVNPDVYSPGPQDPTLLDRLQLPSGVPLIIQVATNLMNSRKMQPLTMLAFRSLIDQTNTDALLYIHSPSQGFFQLEDVAKAAGLWGRKRLALNNRAGPGGHMIGLSEEEMAGLYRSSAVLVNLSSNEGFDSPMAEAASCGVPTVVTDFPVHREVLGHWVGRHQAYYVPSRQLLPHPIRYEWLADPDAAADLMAKALEAPKGSGGVPEELTWAASAVRLEEFCGALTR